MLDKGPLFACANSDDTEKDSPNPILVRVKEGDVGAFQLLLRAQESRVLRSALRLLGSLEDAQDAAQETFLRLYKYRHRIDVDRDIAPFIYRMTVNVCRDLARKTRKTDTVSIEALEMDFESPGRSAEECVVIDEQRAVLLEGLKTLSGKEREALVLREIEGLDTCEVAAILGSTQTTVRSQISRGLVKLRRFQKERLENET